MVPENIHPNSKVGNWKCHRRGEGGRGKGEGKSQKPQFLKESMNQNWNFQREGEVLTKKPNMGGVSNLK